MDRTLVTTHNGTEIYVDEKGKFSATRDGEKIEAGSLATIKKRLDAAAAVITPVPIMILGAYGSRKRLITGSGQKSRRSYGADRCFEIDGSVDKYSSDNYYAWDESLGDECNQLMKEFNRRETSLKMEREAALKSLRQRAVVLTQDEIMKRLRGENAAS